MEVALGILVLLVLGYGAMRLLKTRGRKRVEKQAHVEKRAKNARTDAMAIQRSLDGRR